MSIRLQILRDGHVIDEYDSLEHLKTIVALLDDEKIIEFISAIQTAITLYRGGAKFGAFRIGSFRIKFQGGDDP